MRKRDGPSLTLRNRKTWTSPKMPLKARQHQGPVQMSGCCDTSQKEAVSQWKPGGQRKNKLGRPGAIEDPYTVYHADAEEQVKN